MKKTALVLLAGAIGACAHDPSHENRAPARTTTTTTTTTTTSDAWVATAADLSPEQVRMVQRALGDRGFPVEPSGSFDASTRTALNDFQRSRGLPETGNLNADTAAALGLDPHDVMPVRGGAPAATTTEPTQPSPTGSDPSPAAAPTGAAPEGTFPAEPGSQSRSRPTGAGGSN
jgi:peptidoglycan hydrolase-like protein with peptidoglycan-binding domain